MFVGVLKKYIHGFSGTELPPPVVKTERVTYLFVDETEEEAKQRMKEIGLRARERSRAEPVKEYSSPDGYDWEVFPIDITVRDKGAI